MLIHFLMRNNYLKFLKFRKDSPLLYFCKSFQNLSNRRQLALWNLIYYVILAEVLQHHTDMRLEKGKPLKGN